MTQYFWVTPLSATLKWTEKVSITYLMKSKDEILHAVKKLLVELVNTQQTTMLENWTESANIIWNIKDMNMNLV